LHYINKTIGNIPFQSLVPINPHSKMCCVLSIF